MSGFIILQDGRALGKSNSTFDAIVGYIAEAITSLPDGQELAQWLMEQRSIICGPGMGRVDVRELTPKNKLLFIQGCRQGFRVACKRAENHAEFERKVLAKGKLKNSTTTEWVIEPFALLMLMIEAVEKGEPPMALNPHMREVVKPTGKRSGPGWEKEAA